MVNDREKRKAKRVSYICEIQAEGVGIGKLNARINNISTTGLFIESLACLAVGTSLNLRFGVLGVQVEVEGEVRYCKPQVGMGIQFKNLKPEYHYMIGCLVDRRPANKEIFAMLSEDLGDGESAPATPSPALPYVVQEVAATDKRPSQSPLPTAQQSGIVQPPAPNRSTAELQMIEDEAIILMGSIAVISLCEVIQMIENSKVSGELTITSPDRSGAIYFNVGRVVNAKDELSYGATPMTTLLGLTEGSFRFRKTDEQYAQAIQVSNNTELLLDLLAARDEEMYWGQRSRKPA